MKVLLINGSPNEHGCTFTALNEVSDAMKRRGIETEIFWIGKKAVQGCIACFKCTEIGHCIFNDEVTKLAARIDEFDGFVIGSPVYYAGVSGSLCAFLDRFFFSGDNSSNKSRFANKPGACVVSCRRGGATAAFDRLNKYFTIKNMPVVSSQYWNQVHGNTPEEVKQDLEGMQTMRTLGENFAWLLKCIDAGKKAGIDCPEREETVYTNFIR
ncbi:MAG: flavodoxin family protein [Synergistaceae bacterium]|nr:flavodoxin family protein [Synergistaceae bacterium]MBQ3450395.1 flavodoxin family protein [Synergistaceae bacterium]MBQ3693172.1 flavodoxin family protein [Synergistaceae bacterium]MBQ6112320.1 flavodoxin family protein [Synergistaceae bacterium]